MTNPYEKLNQAGTMHYLTQLYDGLDDVQKTSFTKELERLLTSEQVSEIFNETKQDFDKIVARRKPSKPINKDYREADFEHMYFSEMFSNLNIDDNILFIKSLESNFNSDRLADFKQRADASLDVSVRKIIDMLQSFP